MTGNFVDSSSILVYFQIKFTLQGCKLRMDEKENSSFSELCLYVNLILRRLFRDTAVRTCQAP